MAQSGQAESQPAGFHIADQLVLFKNEVQKAADNTDNLNLADLADAVFDLIQQLIDGIQSQKALGMHYENETQIIDEANALTDKVIIQLVRDEYKWERRLFFRYWKKVSRKEKSFTIFLN